MFIAWLVLAGLIVAGEHHLNDGFAEADRKEMRAERMEDQPLGQYPRELSLEVSKTVAETGR